jgi:hypothetical protein
MTPWLAVVVEAAVSELEVFMAEGLVPHKCQ